tara:strand:+ start:6050 stop:6334 length:285 start_codon:yes stop_codon:yes gene_type:complete
MIPLPVTSINGNEWEYVKDCFNTGWISSAGGYVNKFEEAIQIYTGVKHAVACMNGTAGAVLPKLTIGKGAAIGAGAVVISDISANKTVVGVPAK